MQSTGGIRMLFDHQIDVEENKNRANDPSYKNIIKDMSSFLHKKKRTLNK